MDKLKIKKSLLSVILVITLASTLQGCSTLPVPIDAKSAEPVITGIIPDTGDELPTEVVVPVPPAQTESKVDLNAFSNTIWVNAAGGSDAASGASLQTAVSTLQQAADLAGPGTVVRIMPGTYREAVVPANDGTESQPILYLAEEGLNSVIIRGSEPSSSLVWTKLHSNTIGLPSGVNPSNIYFADLASWGLTETPHFLAIIGPENKVTSTLRASREPDWQVQTDFKYTEFWWMANGGSAVAGCDPTKDPNYICDFKWRSYTQLTDTLSDSIPEGVEGGNLKTLGNLVGASLVAMDSYHALYVYRRTITQHDVAAGRITVDEECNNDGSPGLGWGSKYYLENHPALLDQPGEWWYDKLSGRLYLWSPDGIDPSKMPLEISRYDNGVDLSERSYIHLNGMQIELFNGAAVMIDNTSRYAQSHGNQITNSSILYANKGILLHAYLNEPGDEYSIDGFTLENSDIGFIDTTGFESTYWWDGAPSPSQFTHSGIRNLVIRNNIMHHLGFNSRERSPVGIRIFFPDQVSFEGNHIYNTAQNGVQFHQSLIESSRFYDVNPSEILIGDILIKNNLFEYTCLASSDCGALKISGGKRPYTHIFRNLLVAGNIFRNNYGWSFVSILRHMNDYGDANGFYLDYAAGVQVYRNIAFNNSGAGFKLTCLWRDDDTVLFNNIAANNYLYGFKFTGMQGCDDHNGSVNTQLINNTIINNGLYGIQFNSAYTNQYGNLTIDNNLYFQNGWNNPSGMTTAYLQLFRDSLPTEYFESLNELRTQTPWEDHGQEGNPFLAAYDASFNDVYTDIWPDFSPTSKSAHLIDKGTIGLTGSLANLITVFRVEDLFCGRAFDIGRFEFTQSGQCVDFKEIFLPLIVR